MKPLSKKVLKIASTARQLTESFAKKNPSIGDPHDLECYCAIGSKMLVLLAKKYGYDFTFIQGQYGQVYYDNSSDGSGGDYLNHCWTEYNSRIIDITATQFGISDPVYIVEKNHPYYHAVYRTNRMMGEWSDQNPNKYSAINRMVAKAIVK